MVPMGLLKETNYHCTDGGKGMRHTVWWWLNSSELLGSTVVTAIAAVLSASHGVWLEGNGLRL